MTTAEEKRRGNGSAVLAVFAGATIGAVVGGWIGSWTYVEPDPDVLDIGGFYRALLVGAIVFMVIGGTVGLGLWSIAVRERRRTRQDEEWHQEWQDQGK